MTIAWKLCAAIFLAGVLYTTLKSWLPAWAPLLAAACSVFILMLLFADRSTIGILQWFTALQANTDTQLLSCVYRTVGILLLTDLARDFCKDAGMSAAAGCMDFAGRILVLITIEPMITLITKEIQHLTG